MKLYFRNIKSEIIEVETELFNTPVKDKWFELLENVLKNDFIAYVKTFSLVGGFSQNRTPDVITQQLVDGIRLLKKASWYPEYNEINEPFESLLEKFDRDLLNAGLSRQASRKIILTELFSEFTTSSTLIAESCMSASLLGTSKSVGSR